MIFVNSYVNLKMENQSGNNKNLNYVGTVKRTIHVVAVFVEGK